MLKQIVRARLYEQRSPPKAIEADLAAMAVLASADAVHIPTDMLSEMQSIHKRMRALIDRPPGSSFGSGGGRGADVDANPAEDPFVRQWRLLQSKWGTACPSVDELLRLTGLATLKREFLNLYTQVHIAKMQNRRVDSIPAHAVFEGNPGTGTLTCTRDMRPPVRNIVRAPRLRSLFFDSSLFVPALSRRSDLQAKPPLLVSTGSSSSRLVDCPSRRHRLPLLLLHLHPDPRRPHLAVPAALALPPRAARRHRPSPPHRSSRRTARAWRMAGWTRGRS